MAQHNEANYFLNSHMNSHISRYFSEIHDFKNLHIEFIRWFHDFFKKILIIFVYSYALLINFHWKKLYFRSYRIRETIWWIRYIKTSIKKHGCLTILKKARRLQKNWPRCVQVTIRSGQIWIDRFHSTKYLFFISLALFSLWVSTHKRNS